MAAFMPAAAARSRNISGPDDAARTSSRLKPTSTDWMPARWGGRSVSVLECSAEDAFMELN
ncbi:hypothetical protein LP417_11300 [Polaromonas sp. P1-6]|nr:hypothetical protein LP417_11300 [Polaromonas sp. P1-6]